MAIDPMQLETDILAQCLEPLGECLTPEVAQKIVDFRASPELQARIDELADKCNEGELTPEEASEYDRYVDAIDVVAMLKAQVRAVLKTPTAA